MAKALVFERADEHGNPVKCLMACPPGNPLKAMKQHSNMADMAAPESSDEKDDDYKEFEDASSPGSDAGDNLVL
jgi:hypothetical protein